MTLRLNREVLTELTADDLTGVVGGSHHCLTLPVHLCLSVRWCEVSHAVGCEVTLAATCLC